MFHSCFIRGSLCLALLACLSAISRAAEPDDWLCACEAPGTLFRWSYGDTTGGPPGPDEPLASDRPDFTEASSTVGRGVIQLEMGYTYTADDDGPSHSHSSSYPELLARFGLLAEWFEFRVGFNYGSFFSQPGPLIEPNEFSGSEDLYLGIKLMLTPQEGILPEMSIMPQWTVPTGHSQLTSDMVLPGVSWLYGWDINDFLSTAGSTQVNKAVDDLDEIYHEFAQSWTFGYSFTDYWGGYTEWFVLVPSGSDIARTQHYFNGGFIFPVTNDLQFDVRAGVGLSDASDDYFASVGMVVRL
ncbi:MAG: transporter [Planctomycetaceae bacterium]|nr:transporter [Planctomycetaceae bacterium]